MSAENTEIHSGQRRRRELLVLTILAAVQFATVVDFMIVMPLDTQLMRALDINPSQFSWIVSAYAFAAGAVGLIASSIMDRFARRSAFMVLYGGFLLGTLSCGLAPTYGTLVLARTITGAFGGILGGIAMTIIGDVFPENRRASATGALMAGFGLATAVGVPLGLVLGTRFGWHVPFIALAIAGTPMLLLTPFAMPRLDGHLGRSHRHPLRELGETFTSANHLNAFALIAVLMIGGFCVFPFLADYLVENVGLTQQQLPIIYIVGGGLTLLAAPVIGRLADRFGKLTIYRIICPFSVLLLVALTHLPPVSVALAAAAYGALMVSNVGRMIAAMAMVTSSVEPRRRGGFLSANSSVQHIASGLGAKLGGSLISKSATGSVQHFGTVGWIAAIATLSTLWLIGRVRIVDEGAPSATTLSLAAAAEATVDAGEPLLGSVDEG